eukprot:m51a1_g7172 hypothetical protein (344) ;mRNA; r:66254-67285
MPALPLRLLARILRDSAEELLDAARFACELVAPAVPRLRAPVLCRPVPQPSPSLDLHWDLHVFARVLSLLPERSDVLSAALTCRTWHLCVRTALSTGALVLPPSAPAPHGTLDTQRNVLLVLWALVAVVAATWLRTPWVSLALAASVLFIEVVQPSLCSAGAAPHTFLVCVRTEPDAEYILAMCPMLLGLHIVQWAVAGMAPPEWASAAMLGVMVVLGFREASLSVHSRVLRRALLTCSAVPVVFCGLCAVLWWPVTALGAAGLQGFLLSVAWPVVSRRVVGGTLSLSRYTRASRGDPPDSASGATLALLALIETREMLRIAASPVWFTSAVSACCFLLAASE